MKAIGDFEKYDKYKKSSYNSYNFKMPEIYDKNFWMTFFKNDEWDREVIKQLGNSLDSISVLDVGCATGRLLFSLTNAGVKNLCGSDIASNILDVAKQKLSSFDVRLDLKTADAEEHLPWDENSFDYVTLTGVFHHFYTPQKALKEIYRVLKPGGRFIVIEPWFPPVLRQVTNLYLLFFPHDGDCRFHSPNGLVGLAASANLTKVKINRMARLSFMLVAEKK
ncbi:class I SAM-dependent methyltransferase [Thermodesulfobacteriota bacterium]